MEKVCKNCQFYKTEKFKEKGEKIDPKFGVCTHKAYWFDPLKLDKDTCQHFKEETIEVVDMGKRDIVRKK